MIKMDEKSALAILFANTRRKNRSENLVTIAEACEYLIKLYGSQEAVAKKIGISTEMIREFRKILSLSPKVLKMVRSREIDRLDDAYRLAKIRDADIQIEAAKEVFHLQSKDVRALEDLLSNTQLSTKEATKLVLESKLKGLHIFLIDFDDKEYNAILQQSKAAKIAPAALIKKAVVDWLRESIPISRPE